MKKKLLIGFFLVVLAIVMCIILTGCGNKENASIADNGKQEEQQPVSSTDWPTNTIFPKPEGCKIIEVRKEDWKNYITVEWESVDAARNYAKIAKEVEGDEAEVIGTVDYETAYTYGTYAITITSENQPENIILYK